MLAYLYSNPIFLLRRIDQRAVSLFNDAARELRLTLPQFHLLYIASEVGAFSQVDLARQVAINEATASTTISHLIDRGLLTRSPDKTDGRRKLIAASPAGQEMVKAALPVLRGALAELEAPLGDDRGRLIELLTKFIEHGGGTIAVPLELNDEEAAQKLHIVHGSLHFLVHKAIQLLEAAMNPDVLASGITLRQYVVLLIITLGPGIGESSIASTVGLDLSNTSFIARGLRTKNLVAVDEGTRRRQYEPTSAGRQLLAGAGAPVDGLNHGMSRYSWIRPKLDRFCGYLARSLAAEARPRVHLRSRVSAQARTGRR